jgi:hypothetical protein
MSPWVFRPAMRCESGFDIALLSVKTFADYAELKVMSSEDGGVRLHELRSSRRRVGSWASSRLSFLVPPWVHLHKVCGSACGRLCQGPFMAPIDHIHTLRGAWVAFEHVVAKRQAVGGD